MQNAMWLMQLHLSNRISVGPARSQHRHDPLTLGGKQIQRKTGVRLLCNMEYEDVLLSKQADASKRLPPATPRSRMEEVVLPRGPFLNGPCTSHQSAAPPHLSHWCEQVFSHGPALEAFKAVPHQCLSSPIACVGLALQILAT